MSKTTDEKTERLLNLVLALLGTRRYLKKSEIINVIPGYEGSPDAKERMFERDKDELRRIGIEIEVSLLDPLFEDEVGYRISRQSFGSNLPALSAEEGLIAMLALLLLADIGLGSNVRSALIKLRAHAVLDLSFVEQIFTKRELLESARSQVAAACLDALRRNKELVFLYQKESDGTTEERRVRPLKLEIRDAEWHLIAWDENRNGPRTFLLENVIGIPSVSSRTFSPESLIAQNIPPVPYTVVEVKASNSKISLLESEGGVIINTGSTHSTLEFRVYNVDRLLRLILGIDSAIQVITPNSLVTRLKELRQGMIDAI